MIAWDHIAAACRMIAEGNVERIDGDGWKAYRAGTIIRVDLSADFNPDKHRG